MGTSSDHELLLLWVLFVVTGIICAWSYTNIKSPLWKKIYNLQKILTFCYNDFHNICTYLAFPPFLDVPANMITLLRSEKTMVILNVCVCLCVVCARCLVIFIICALLPQRSTGDLLHTLMGCFSPICYTLKGGFVFKVYGMNAHNTSQSHSNVRGSNSFAISPTPVTSSLLWSQ